MGNICIIGPRDSGKTTYLAALAYKMRASKNSKKFNIQPLGDDSKDIAEKAENIICQGASFEPNKIGGMTKGVDDLPLYSFNIEIQNSWFTKPDSFQLNVRDYPGEIFEKIADSNQSDPICEEFIEECLRKDVIGCLILLTAWDRAADALYNKVMNRFIDLMDNRDRTKDFRLAVAMSKSERGELWSGRLDPETDLFRLHLPNTTDTLRNSRILSQNLVRFYAISTFGVLDKNDPRPNRIDERGKYGKASVLRHTKSWKPYNLIEPLHWLSQTTKSNGKVK
ncbi:TRAFAC clade GTPase domain-containing protein [Microcoleus sp. herbarium2]|uniref:TRAFAC clade GTPase domain-containing protein n=1 Tax=Microcoleus sp. herbarium2 TaxID=3055433 RepID=UPI002FCFC64D